MRLELHALLTIILLPAIVFTASAQHQVSVEAGIGNYAFHGAKTRLDMSQNGKIFGHGESEVPGFSNMSAFAVWYRYACSRRFGLGAGIRHQSAAGWMNQGDYLRRPGSDSNIKVDLSSYHSLRATSIDFVAWFNLLPERKIALLAGTGLSLLFREHDFRSYLRVDYDNQNQPGFGSVEYLYDAENAAGIPLLLQADMPLFRRWHLLGSASAGFYRNRDISLLLTAGLAYHW